MTDAVAAPTRRPREERSSRDHETLDPAAVTLDLDRTPEVEDIVVSQEVLNKKYADALKFSEEPVTIIIEASGDENAPPFQESWVNGRGIEFFIQGRWFPNWPGVAAGYCPVGVEFTTKRKYVEVLLRKREIKIDTRHEDATVEKPINRVTRRAVHRSPLSVLADQNPKGRAWLAQMMRE